MPKRHIFVGILRRHKAELLKKSTPFLGLLLANNKTCVHHDERKGLIEPLGTTNVRNPRLFSDYL
jgi:hypothetical protein